MKLFCKTCGEAIPAHDINIELAIAKCGRCHTVFKFPDELEDSARGAPAKPVEIEMPRGLAVDEWGSELTIVRRWFTPALFFLVFFCCIWDGFLIVWYSIALSSMPGDMAWLALLFPLLHVAVGVGLTYYTICGFVNRTTVHVASGELRVSHRPLPWPGARRIAVLDLDRHLPAQRLAPRWLEGPAAEFHRRAAAGAVPGAEDRELPANRRPLRPRRNAEDLIASNAFMTRQPAPIM